MPEVTENKPEKDLSFLDAPKNFEVYGPGNLEPDSVWWARFFRRRETLILNLSATIIVALLLVGLAMMLFSESDMKVSWAAQILTALLGFAAGALFTTVTSNNSESNR